MRISDWSSDVCSSDLVTVKRARVCRQLRRFDKIVRKPDHDMLFARPHLVARRYQKGTGMAADSEAEHFRSGLRAFHPLEFSLQFLRGLGYVRVPASRLLQHPDARSEERRVGKECVSTWRSRWSTNH